MKEERKQIKIAATRESLGLAMTVKTVKGEKVITCRVSNAYVAIHKIKKTGKCSIVASEKKFDTLEEFSRAFKEDVKKATTSAAKKLLDGKYSISDRNFDDLVNIIETNGKLMTKAEYEADKKRKQEKATVIKGERKSA